MSSDVDALVKEAIRAVKAGKKAEARLLLERATDADPENEKAWMWMSAVVDEPGDQRICLENVLIINPSNANAQKGLDMLRKNHPEVFVEEEQQPPVPPPIEEPPQESNWNIPVTATSSASSVFVPEDQPTPDVYDDWVAGLNLGSDDNGSTSYQSDEGQFLDNLDFMDALEDDDSASLRLDSMESSSAFTSDVFSSADFADEDTYGESSFGSSYEDDQDDLLDEFDMDDTQGDLLGDPLLDDNFDDDLLSSIEDDPLMSPMESQSATAFAVDNNTSDEHDPSVYFNSIPDDIVATRIPGTDESYPTLVVVGLIVLILLNLGALGFLVMNLSA